MSGVFSSFPRCGYQFGHPVGGPLPKLGKNVRQVVSQVDVQPTAGFHDRDNCAPLWGRRFHFRCATSSCVPAPPASLRLRFPHGDPDAQEGRRVRVARTSPFGSGWSVCLLGLAQLGFLDHLAHTHAGFGKARRAAVTCLPKTNARCIYPVFYVPGVFD